MTVTTVTVKGQVTIPKPVRDLLQLSAGSKVGFIVTDDDEVVIRPVSRRVDEVYGRLVRYRKETPVSVEEMDGAIKARMKGRFDEGR